MVRLIVGLVRINGLVLYKLRNWAEEIAKGRIYLWANKYYAFFLNFCLCCCFTLVWFSFVM
ncbi:hypothetical protein Hanom_Chr01g00030631 [Helianthus anomalus]